MDGIRLDSHCFEVKTCFGIREIIDCLAPEISGLYCATHGEFLKVSPNSTTTDHIKKFDQEYDDFLLEELNHVGVEILNLKLFKHGFLSKFRDFLYGDWTGFYLLDTKIILSRIHPWSNELPSECKIFIRCVDAGYWEVFADDSALLTRLKDRFPSALSSRLEDKTV